jgi:LPS-assembly lipoprotein
MKIMAITLLRSRSWVILFLALFIAGCGFHLRGMAPLPPNIKVIGLQSINPYGSLTQLLKQILPSLGAQIVPVTDNPPIILAIDSDTFGTDSTVQSASSSTQQYTMTYVVVYHVEDAKGNTLFGPKQIHLSEIYSVNQNQVLSTDSVQQNTEHDLQQQAVIQIVTQLGSTSAQQALAKVASK